MGICNQTMYVLMVFLFMQIDDPNIASFVGGIWVPHVTINGLINLVGGLEHFGFSHILGIIIPID